MKLEYKFLITALLAIILAAPIAPAIHTRTNLLKRGVGTNLHLNLKTKEELAQLDKPHNKANVPAPPVKAPAAAPVAATPVVAVVAPAVPETPAPTGCVAYRDILAQYDWNVNTAAAIMQAESGCSATVVSSTCDHGLMQINCIHADMVGGDLTALNDPATNIRIAYALYVGRGWQPWTTYTSGAYLRYL